MVSLRRDRSKYGFYLNAEQQIAKDVGIFGRVSWADGQNEILSFADIDRSVSGGISVKGSYWGRENDTFGLGGVVNGLTSSHRDFLAAGGAWPFDRGWPVELPAGKDSGDLLRLQRLQGDDAVLELSIRGQSGLQRRPRSGLHRFGTHSFRVLTRELNTRQAES